MVLFVTHTNQILKKNLYYIVSSIAVAGKNKLKLSTQIPLMLLLLGSVVLAIFDTIGLFWGMFSGQNPSASHAFWCCKRSLFLHAF